MHEQGSTFGSNSSKMSPGGLNPRVGIDATAFNTKSYNSLLAMLMNKDQDIYTVGGTAPSQVKYTLQAPNANLNNAISKVSRVDLENTIKRAAEFKASKQVPGLYSSKPMQKFYQKIEK